MEFLAAVSQTVSYGTSVSGEKCSTVFSELGNFSSSTTTAHDFLDRTGARWNWKNISSEISAP